MITYEYTCPRCARVTIVTNQSEMRPPTRNPDCAACGTPTRRVFRQHCNMGANGTRYDEHTTYLLKHT